MAEEAAAGEATVTTAPEAAPVVITDCDHDTIAPEEAVLAAAGLPVRLAACRTPADVIEQAAGAHALIVQYARIDDAVLSALDACRIVVRYGVGVDTIDVPAATRRGVWVANVPDYGVAEVSDHALALLLGLLRAVPRLDRAVRAGAWDVTAVAPLRRLSALTVGVLGCGRIGAAFAAKAARVGLGVIAHDPLGVPESVQRIGVHEVGYEELLATADAVSLHLPLTPETHHLIDANALAHMKRGAYLVNTARGGLVDGRALLAALESGQIAGAGLDVLEQEPPDPDDPLLVHDRVVITPHAAWYSLESERTLKTEAAREVVRVLSGERPRSPVNEPTDSRNAHA